MHMSSFFDADHDYDSDHGLKMWWEKAQRFFKPHFYQNIKFCGNVFLILTRIISIKVTVKIYLLQ